MPTELTQESAKQLMNEAPTVIIPERYNSVGMMAFQDKDNQQAFHVVGKNIEYIRTAAFAQSKLMSANFEQLLHIHWGAFSNCHLLASAKLGNRLLTIDGVAFAHCKALSLLELPRSLITIGTDAFLGTPKNMIIITEDDVHRQKIQDMLPAQRHKFIVTKTEIRTHKQHVEYQQRQSFFRDTENLLPQTKKKTNALLTDLPAAIVSDIFSLSEINMKKIACLNKCFKGHYNLWGQAIKKQSPPQIQTVLPFKVDQPYLAGLNAYKKRLVKSMEHTLDENNEKKRSNNGLNFDFAPFSID